MTDEKPRGSQAEPGLLAGGAGRSLWGLESLWGQRPGDGCLGKHVL